MRLHPRHLGVFALPLLVLGLAACGGDDEESANEEPPTVQQVAGAAAGTQITEDNLPEGFEKTPTVELDGKEWRFDDVPGHYWKVIDDRGYAVGLHFQTAEPFRWARDVAEGQLLYMVYAIPGNCGNGSFAQASKAPDASIAGALPGGFDHWHALVGGGSKTGHWLMHTPVRDFTFAGEEGNPMAGTKVQAGDPGFMPVCDIR